MWNYCLCWWFLRIHELIIKIVLKCSGTVCLAFATYFVWESFWKDAVHVKKSEVLSHWHVGKWNVCVCNSAKTDCEVVAASLPRQTVRLWLHQCQTTETFWPNPQQDCAVLKSFCWLVNCVQCANLVELVVICKRMGIDCMRAYCIKEWLGAEYKKHRTQDRALGNAIVKQGMLRLQTIYLEW